ncbi:hypothetical protein ABVK25_001150 [Lepraria finkii]|uniref:Uncharacterized protein n=1 Tax=Lepraria finkii TaxID=1340010 RepID=A0ABR4BKT8_9LECA
MDGSFETYGSPPVKTEQRWGREDIMDRQPSGNDPYRGRRSPGMQDRRGGHRGGRARSRSPMHIDRYQPGARLPRDDFMTNPAIMLHATEMIVAEGHLRHH